MDIYSETLLHVQIVICTYSHNLHQTESFLMWEVYVRCMRKKA